MVWTCSVCPSLKSRGQQLTKTGEKENYKNIILSFSVVSNINSWRVKSSLSNVVSLVLSSCYKYHPLSENVINSHRVNILPDNSSLFKHWSLYSCVDAQGSGVPWGRGIAEDKVAEARRPRKWKKYSVLISGGSKFWKKKSFFPDQKKSIFPCPSFWGQNSWETQRNWRSNTI